jgi:hypothetical protein
VYNRSLGGEQPVGETEAWHFVRERIPGTSESVARAMLRSIATELEAEVTVDDAGVAHYRFPEVHEQFAASESMRRRLRLEQRTLGEIVFSTGDDPAEATARDLELFDRELLEGGANLEHYLPTLDRVDYEDDLELVAFDEELRRGRDG